MMTLVGAMLVVAAAYAARVRWRLLPWVW